MLYLPRGIYAWIGSAAWERGAKIGRLLIEIVCKFAWESGFTCDHKEFNYDKKLSSKNVRIDKCGGCGMRRAYAPANGAAGSAPWGYTCVSVVGRS